MKFFKNITAILLMVVVIFAQMIFPTYAAETMSFTAGSCDAIPGETVSIPISLKSNSGFVSMSLSVTYDTSALTLISYEDTGVIAGASHSSHFTSPYVLTWENDTLTSNITSTGTIIYLTFLVSEDAKEQDYSVIVRIPTDGILDANGDTVSASSAMGTITVSAEHECSFGAWEYYSKTKHVRYCDGDDCDEKEYENHNWNDGEIIEEPSHDVEGEIEYACEDCGATKTTEIDPKGHDWSDWTKFSATQHKRSCSCGDVEYEAHDWDAGVVTKQPAHGVKGEITYTCTDCGYTQVEPTEQEEHSYGEWIEYSSTHHKRTCSCGDMQTAPHEWDKGTVLKNPTATEEGLKVYTCLVCGDTKNESIPVVLIPVTGISLAETRLTLEEGDILNLTATIFPSNATNQAVVWTSDNPAIARVAPFANSTAARIYAEQEGIATITVKTVDGSYMATCVVTVTSPEPDVIPVTGITLSESAVTVRVGDGKFINATIFPDNATNKLVNWTCSDPTVADIAWTVGNKLQGAIIAKAEGTAVITVSTADGSYTAQCMVTVVANPNAPTICINNETASAGKTVQVNIALKNNPGIASMKLKVAYDESILTLQQIVYNSAMGGQSQQPQNLTSPVTLNWYNGAANSNGDFVYATLTFLVKDSAQAGETNITVTYDPEDVYNIDFDNINFAVQNGQITIVDHIPGDVSGDGAVNNKDLSLLFQYLSDWNVTVNEAALDINGDGKVNNKDLSLLFQYLSDWDVEIY